MTSKNRTNRKGHQTPYEQPSLLEQLDLDEDPAREDHQPQALGQESLGQEDGDIEQRAAQAELGTEEPRSTETDQQPEPPPADQPPEPLIKAYARYAEIVNSTYNSAFSDAKRQAAFKEAARAHSVRIADLKRYSTAEALGIPYQTAAEGGADTEPAPGARPPAADTQ